MSAPVQLQSVGAALAEGAQALAAASAAPHLEAQLLLGALLERERPWLLAHPEAPLSPAQTAQFTDWIARRAAHEPLPYITGHAEFFALPFSITPDVLIPRPETELLVEHALAYLQTREHPVFVDVGTGSGCIAVTLLVHLPTARGFAVDISPAALAVAQRNAERHGVAERLTLLEGDLLAPLPEPVDLIASNPPYIAEHEWDTLPPSVRQEPRGALLAGADGLDAVRALLRQSPSHLLPGGQLLIEIGAGQGKAAQALAQTAYPTAMVHIHADLGGRDRLLKIGLSRS